MANLESLGAQVLKLVKGLPRDWAEQLQRVMQIDPRSLRAAADLFGPRRIDRAAPGFGDFDPASNWAILPGDPASSALYHALASPLVQPGVPGRSWRPSPKDLDLLENYIYALAPLQPDSWPEGAVIGVFAYEYRPAAETVHRKRADFVYSRTGIARVGEERAVWDGTNRCWLNLSGARFAVTPAKYGAFVAVPHPGSDPVVLDAQPDDAQRTVYVPVRKLVNGEAIAGQPLSLRFAEHHRREKLRRLFVYNPELGSSSGLDQPFNRDSINSPGMVKLTQWDGGALVESPPAPLARLAVLPNGNIATLDVPARGFLHLGDTALNRDASSLRVNTGSTLLVLKDALLNGLLHKGLNLRPRNAPEFVNIRHMVDPARPAGPPVDLNAARGADFEEFVNAGGYAAALYEDSTCDGCITVQAPALPARFRRLPAFSIIAPPDFFPYASERDLDAWVNEFLHHNARSQFKAGGPLPLHVGRYPPNLTLRLPDQDKPAFAPADDTAVAIVGRPETDAPNRRLSRPPRRTTSFMPDAASGVFAPGWDVTFAGERGHFFYATFGLGSPFPEDVKLCAADNGFWPAASPDAARTFHKSPTAIPLLDEELGWHPRNPRKPVGLAESFGWDGEQGPFIDGDRVNFCWFWRSDYVSNFLAGRSNGSYLAEADSAELIRRMDCLRLGIQMLPSAGESVAETPLWLVHAERAAVPAAAGAAPSLSGYRFEFVIPHGDDLPDPNDPKRRVQGFGDQFVCLVAPTCLTWSRPGGAVTFAPATR